MPDLLFLTQPWPPVTLKLYQHFNNIDSITGHVMERNSLFVLKIVLLNFMLIFGMQPHCSYLMRILFAQKGCAVAQYLILKYFI